MFLLEVVVFLSWVYFGFSAELPPFITKCPMGSPETVEQCVLGQIKTVLKELKDGYPPFDIPPLDPLFIPSLDLIMTEVMHLKMKDVNVEGLSSANYTRFLPTFQDGEMTSLEVSLEVPQLHTSGLHITKGLFSWLTVDSHGNAILDIDNLKINLKLNIRTDTRYGVKYYQVPRIFDVNLSFGSLNVDIGNLVPDEQQNLDLNFVINSIPEVFFEMIQPGIEDTIRNVVHSLLLKLVTQVPVENFFAL